jgi:hypothetical protein
VLKAEFAIGVDAMVEMGARVTPASEAQIVLDQTHFAFGFYVHRLWQVYFPRAVRGVLQLGRLIDMCAKESF